MLIDLFSGFLSSQKKTQLLFIKFMIIFSLWPLPLNIPVYFFFLTLVVSYFHCQSYGKEILENLHTWHETQKSQLSSDVTCSIKPLNPPAVGLNFPIISAFLVFISIIALFNTEVLGPEYADTVSVGRESLLQEFTNFHVNIK